MIERHSTTINNLNFTKRYIFALSLIALFSISAFFNLKYLIDNQAQDAEIINISGRQRMLSQKIALLALSYKNQPNESVKNELLKNMDLMLTSHNRLLSHKLSDKLHYLYFGPSDLNGKVLRYIDSVKAYLLNGDIKEFEYILKNSKKLLSYLDKAVYEYQIENERKTSSLKRNELFILVFTLLTLFFEALFIFRPANKQMMQKTKELNEAKEYLDTVIESNKNAIIAIDKNKHVLTFNKSATEVFGYGKEEMLNKDSLENIIPQKYLKSHNIGVENYLKTGKSKGILYSSIEIEGRRKNGEIFPLRISFGASNDPKNKIIIANIQDITKEKEKDKLLLEQSRFAAMGEMIGNIAHQWRQPLSAISTIASGARFRKKVSAITEEELDKVFEKIVEHTKFLSHTIDDFRNFFKKDIKIVVFDITDIADESLSLIEATYKNNNIRVVKEHIGKNFKYEGYPRELLQVFLNILGNAKDILIERDTKEKLVLFRIKENSNSSIIEIYDSAGGIPEDIILKIFDPYFTTKHQSHGTGIGLFMSKEIVQKHLKGDLTASNEEFFIDGKRYYGACFRVSLSTFS